MVSEHELRNQLNHLLLETSFQRFGNRYIGKVRDNYTLGDRRILITTDRLSCFDKVVTSVPFKGQILNTLAAFWFEKTKSLVPNHVIRVPHPNVLIARLGKVFPVEVVVRAYLTGSAWRDYKEGKAVSGIRFPAGMKMSQKLEKPLITPSTKAEKGTHDEPISEDEIVSLGIVSKDMWSKVREYALKLFDFGSKEVASRGLLLVDTKYEFGVVDGEITLLDEIHTLDSSRFWLQESYQQRFEAGIQPEMLDKEPTRQWLLEQGFKGDGPIPEFTDEHRIDIAKHYLRAFELISGNCFVPRVGSQESEMERAIADALGA